MTKLYNILMLVAALVAMAAGVWTVVLQVKSKRPELTAEIVSMEELTPPTKLPDLSATFNYKGQSVDRLWKVTLNIANSGDKTLIGEGTQKSLIGDNVPFVFPAGCRLLDTIIVRKDFPANLSQSETGFSISFSQWRKLEGLSISCFVTRSNGSETPKPTADSRCIIDGDIVVRDLSGQPRNTKRSLLEYLPAPISMPSKAVGTISSLIWGGLLFVFGYFILRDLARTKIWRRRHLGELQNFLASQQIGSALQLLYLKSPNRLPKDLWSKYPGKKLDVAMDTIDFTSASATGVLGVILIGIGAATLLLSISEYAKF